MDCALSESARLSTDELTVVEHNPTILHLWHGLGTTSRIINLSRVLTPSLYERRWDEINDKDRKLQLGWVGED